MLEIFTTSKFDGRIILIKEDKEISVRELKELVAYQTMKIRDCSKNVVILGNDNFSFIINFFASVFEKKNIYLISDKSKLNLLDFEYELLDKFEFGMKKEYEFKISDPKDILINFYTSGSSSKSKMIKKSLFNLIREGEDLRDELGIESELIFFSTTTLTHLFGMTFHLMFPIINGSIIGVDSVSYAENLIKDNSVLVSTPAFLSAKVKHNSDFKIDPKYIISAGSKLGEKVFEKLSEHSKVIEIYGSTETGVVGYKLEPREYFRKFKNVYVIPKEDYTEIKSDYVNEYETKINDKLSMKEDRFLIEMRTDRVYKIQEKRVSAEELEERLNQNELIEQSYVLPAGDKLGCICALTKAGMNFIVKNNVPALIKILKLYISKYSEILPQRWRFIDTIPVTKSGKINRELIEHIFSINLSLPVIIERKESPNEVNYKLFFYENCNFYNGHFPDSKITPGVVQLYLAKELANAHFGLNLTKGQYKRIKFSEIIPQNAIVNLNLKLSETYVEYMYFDTNKKYSSGVFVLNI